MRIFSTVLFGMIFGVVLPSAAQSIERFKALLNQPDTLYSSRVEVTEVGDAAQLVQQAAKFAGPTTIEAYCVGIFMDNSQNAREKANEALTQFRSMFPEIPAHLYYESPYFKVTVGKCLTGEEQIALWGRVQTVFPKAFLARERIALKELSQ